MQIGAAHAFVDHVFDAHGRVPLHVHADLEEDGHDAGVLADGAMAFGAHARVDEDLRDGIARGGRLLFFVGARQALDEIDRMVVGNVLQSVSNALDEVVLLDDGHECLGVGARFLDCVTLQITKPKNPMRRNSSRGSVSVGIRMRPFRAIGANRGAWIPRRAKEACSG